MSVYEASDRFAAPAPATQPVSDAETHRLLAEAVAAVEALRAVAAPHVSVEGPAVGVGDVTGLARDETVAHVVARLDALVEVLADVATRPPERPQVNVSAPALPAELIGALERIAALRVPDRLDVDDKLLEAIRDIKPSVAVQGGLGSIAIQKVLEKMAADIRLLTIGTETIPLKTEIEYFTHPGTGKVKPRYVGQAEQGVVRADGEWTVKRISYTSEGQESKIEVLTGVAFDNPDGLLWEA